MRHTLAGPLARANYPGWFWAAGTSIARPVVSGGLRARPSDLYSEVIMSYPTVPAPRRLALVGGAR